MANRNEPQNKPHRQNIDEKTPPRRGTDQPWKRPGQQSQNPSEPDPPEIDLEKWRESNTS
ncbi:hypothetical protein [Bradyrhizobium sp. SYSU BS000235]|uniref:hypothetical protein n=1 Tax=Bradyrhizobium sp. SYSU BS000235 TaxID=3411332 RepID=UPI003C7388ED